MITPQTGLLLLSATAITLVIGVVFVLFIRKISFSSLIYQAKGIRKNRSRSFSIAVITPQADSAAQFLTEGIIRECPEDNGAYQVELFTCDNNRTTISEQCHTALKSFDLVVTHGLACTTIAYKTAAKISSPTPIIFCGVRDYHLSFLHEQAYGVWSGITSQPNFNEQVQLIKSLKDIETVMILHNTHTHSQRTDLIELSEAFENKKVIVQVLPISDQSNINTQLTARVGQIDALFLMKGTLTSHGIQELVTFCNRRNITLFAYDTDSAALGAVVGIGGEQYSLGEQIGRLIQDRLETKHLKDTRAIISHTEHYIFHINKRSLNSQGLALPEYLSYLLEHAHLNNERNAVNDGTRNI